MAHTLLPAFLNKDEFVVMIDNWGKLYGKRPSELLGIIDNDLTALDFDLAIMAKAMVIEVEGFQNDKLNDESKRLKTQIKNIKTMQRKASVAS